MVTETGFTVGIEEEYLIVDRETRELVREAPPSLMAECQEALGEQVSPEFLQCQIEIGTRVCSDLAGARDELRRLRSSISELVSGHGLAMMAASTHPFSARGATELTKKDRYEGLAHDLQQVARRLIISGMHVHVAIEDPEARIDLLGQAAYILPHLLALSTSSPYWEGTDTGLQSYRIAVWDELPRTGMPPEFSSFSEYERHVDVLVRAGVIADATKVWWDLRPSARFPTLEMRISDICTNLEDGLAIAALYRCWLRMLTRLRQSNQRWRTYIPMLLNENRWRAQRYGIDEGLIDFGRGEIVPYPELLDELIALVTPDAEALDCVGEINHARTIITRGTSAHGQRRAYRAARAGGADHHEALTAVVDWLIEASMDF